LKKSEKCIKNHKCRLGKNNSGITEKRCSTTFCNDLIKGTKEQQAPKISPTASTNNEENSRRSCGKPRPTRTHVQGKGKCLQTPQNGSRTAPTQGRWHTARAIFELSPTHAKTFGESSPKMKYFVGRKYIRLLSFVIAQCTFVFPCSAIPIFRNFLDEKTTEK
jgi:hypothetical protein